MSALDDVIENYKRTPDAQGLEEEALIELESLRSALAEREAQATEYRQRCLKAIKELEKLVEETNLENFSREARLNGKIEGIKLALSYFDEMMK